MILCIAFFFFSCVAFFVNFFFLFLLSSAKNRMDHCGQRFVLPDVSHIKTNHPHVPPIFIVQIQIPSEPPPSLFTTVEDGPGWAILIYFRITEVCLLLLFWHPDYFDNLSLLFFRIH